MIKRCMAEFVGTFAIVFGPVAYSASHQSGSADLMTAAWISGLAVVAMIFAFGPISTAHFNPAVTLGFAVAGRFSWHHVLPYWTAQFAGSIFASAVVAASISPGFGTHIPADPSAIVRNISVELILSFLLMSVIMALATGARVAGGMPALGIGLTVVFCVLTGGAITGGSMNPARSLGPALFGHSGALSSYWIYAVAPSLGACLAALLYERIRVDRDSAVSLHFEEP